MPAQAVLKSRLPQIMVELPTRSSAITLAVAEAVAEGAKARAPVASGELRDSIEAKHYTTGVGRGIVQEAAVTAVFYWFFQEFGTAYQPAQPFMIPAAEEARAAVPSIAREVLAEL